jgi:demethylmenaquinone methyltransferase/2-methoxy-6-polyprenyl-1,4-benzoquinol methylase/phosphoethanolamine N-methyltransferase
MIDRARRKAIKAGVDVTFQTALAEALPFSDAQFDVVLSSLMLHHLPEDLRRTGLAEMHRVLKPGGRLLAVDFEPLQHPLGRALTRLVLGHTMASYDIRSCLPMMQAAGFREIESGPTRFRRLSFLRGMTPA